MSQLRLIVSDDAYNMARAGSKEMGRCQGWEATHLVLVQLQKCKIMVLVPQPRLVGLGANQVSLASHGGSAGGNMNLSEVEITSETPYLLN